MNLSDSIKCMQKIYYTRTAGSKEEKCAAKTILEMLGEGAAEEEFVFDDTYCVKENLSFVTRGGTERKISARALLESGTCENLTGQAVYLEDLSPIAEKRAKGKIVILNGFVTREKYENVQKNGAIGCVGIVGSPYDAYKDLPSRLRGPKGRIPAFIIHYKDARRLLEENDAFFLRMDFLKTEKQIYSQNVVQTIRGKTDQTIVLSAHYDSVADGPGAYDNLAAVAILLKIFERHKKAVLEYTLEFAFFGSEESGLKGSNSYVEKRVKEWNKYILNINIDLAGQLIGGNVLGITADRTLVTYLENVMREKKINVHLKHQVWSSDSNSFAKNNIPALTLNRDGFGMHTRYDSLDLISQKSIDASVYLVEAVIEDLNRRKSLPYERRVPKEMIDQMKS